MAIAMRPKITAILSIFVSGNIIREVLLDPNKRKRASYRIMVGVICFRYLSQFLSYSLQLGPIINNIIGITLEIPGRVRVPMQ